MSHRRIITGLLLAAAIGCSEPAASPLAPVNGTVTFRGTPLHGGLIVFTPDEDSGVHGSCATGTIGADGRYALTTDGVPGAVVGKHKVTIAGTENWRLPERFLDPQLSRLVAEVKVGLDNVIDFKLEER